jgi:hypothetical protein
MATAKKPRPRASMTTSNMKYSYKVSGAGSVALPLSSGGEMPLHAFVFETGATAKL